MVKTSTDIPIATLAYAYDALNRPISRNTEPFDYNDRRDVTSAIIAGGSKLYGYDDIVNSTNWPANNLNQYAQFTFNLNGNRTQCGDWVYTYDDANRLKIFSLNGVLLVTNFYHRYAKENAPNQVRLFLQTTLGTSFPFQRRNA